MSKPYIDNITYFECEHCNGTGVLELKRYKILCFYCGGNGYVDWIERTRQLNKYPILSKKEEINADI